MTNNNIFIKIGIYYLPARCHCCKMDRFEYMEARLCEGENYIKRDKNVKLYDGDDKVGMFLFEPTSIKEVRNQVLCCFFL